MQYLDGKRLRRAVNAGWLRLDNNREHLNAINVFPVADGDTGTNMALTLKAAVTGANSAKSDSLQDVADSIAIHSLKGAQGNSGVILSQYFKGVAEYVGSRDRLNLDEVAGVFSAGADSAYGALKDPKEGTILTVVREMGEHLKDTKNHFSCLRNLLGSAIDQGHRSVKETKSKLQVLADADVVDAGGEGFVNFIEGIYQLIKTGEMPRIIESRISAESLPEMVIEHSAFRYCSEYLVKGTGFDSDSIKNRLDDLGDSLIVACTSIATDEYLRIHIHTDTPETVKEIAGSLGTLESTKVDDMKAQNTAMRKWRAKFKKTAKKTVRIVTDSTADLPAELARFYDIEVVPLKVMFGSEVYRDGVDLNKEQFYEKLASFPDTPKTSQPSPGDFVEAYKKVFERGDCDSIISLHVSSKLSGTFNSALQGAEEFKDKILHYDTQSVSMGLGLQTVTAAEMARNGDSPRKIMEYLEKRKESQKLFFTLGTMEYLIKGGRVGAAKGFVGKLLGLKPLLSLENGVIIPYDKARSEEKLLEKIISVISEDVSPGGRWAVGHAAIPSRMDEIVAILGERLGAENVHTGEIGPTVGTHTGPGTWGIFYMRG
ncbi:MAG: DegV family protein [candidate division Zixibacteria bacterium]